MGWRAEPTPSVDQRRRTGDGAPYDVWESISVKPASSVIRRKGRRGRRPLRWLRYGTFQRSREVRFITPVALYAARPFLLSSVGRTVLGAPRSSDRRGALAADVERDRQHPRHPRCARLRPPPSVCNPAGTARAPFRAGAPTFSVHPRREGVEALPYGGWGRYPPLINVGRNPSVTALCAATAPLSGEPWGGRVLRVYVCPRLPRRLSRVFTSSASFSPVRRGGRAFLCPGRLRRCAPPPL